MPEPTTTTAAAAATLVSALTVFGVSLGLRPDGLAEVLVEGGLGLNCLIATFH